MTGKKIANVFVFFILLAIVAAAPPLVVLADPGPAVVLQTDWGEVEIFLNSPDEFETAFFDAGDFTNLTNQTKLDMALVGGLKQALKGNDADVLISPDKRHATLTNGQQVYWGMWLKDGAVGKVDSVTIVMRTTPKWGYPDIIRNGFSIAYTEPIGTGVGVGNTDIRTDSTFGKAFQVFNLPASRVTYFSFKARVCSGGVLTEFSPHFFKGPTITDVTPDYVTCCCHETHELILPVPCEQLLKYCCFVKCFRQKLYCRTLAVTDEIAKAHCADQTTVEITIKGDHLPKMTLAEAQANVHITPVDNPAITDEVRIEEVISSTQDALTLRLKIMKCNPGKKQVTINGVGGMATTTFNKVITVAPDVLTREKVFNAVRTVGSPEQLPVTMNLDGDIMSFAPAAWQILSPTPSTEVSPTAMTATSTGKTGNVVIGTAQAGDKAQNTTVSETIDGHPGCTAVQDVWSIDLVGMPLTNTGNWNDVFKTPIDSAPRRDLPKEDEDDNSDDNTHDGDKDGAPKPSETEPGLYVGLNADDDNANGIQDMRDGENNIVQEDDLQKVELRVRNAPVGAKVALTIFTARPGFGPGDQGRIKVWKDRTKNALIMDGSGGNLIGGALPVSNGDIPLWVEGVELSNAPRDVVLIANKLGHIGNVETRYGVDTLDITVIGPTAQRSRDASVSARAQYGGLTHADEELLATPGNIANREKKLHLYTYSTRYSTRGGDESDIYDDIFSYDNGKYWHDGNFTEVIEFLDRRTLGEVVVSRYLDRGIVDQEFLTYNQGGLFLVSDQRLLIGGGASSPYTVVGKGGGRVIVRLYQDLESPDGIRAGIRPPGWLVDVIEANMLTELNGTAPVNNDDEAIEKTTGAVVVLNEDDDNRNMHRDTEDGQVSASGAIPRSADENDLKKISLQLFLHAIDKGQVILRRSNGRIQIYSDPRKGIAADNDRAILWSVSPGVYNAAVEGNGRKTWNLAIAADKAALEAILASGIYVEGRLESGAKQDTELVFEFIPTDASIPAYKDTIKFTVVPLNMDFITQLADIGGNLTPIDPLNKVHNPATIVIESAPTAENVARLILKSAPYVGEDDDFVEWNIVAENGNGRFFVVGDGEDKTGTMARVYGLTDGRMRIEAKVKAAEHPYIVYRPLVARELTVPYRCNFLVSTTGVRNAILPERIPDIMAVANRIMRQLGVRLVPDPDIATDVIPSGIVAAPIAAADTSVVVPNAARMFCQHARLRITHGATMTTAVVDSVAPATSTITFTTPIGTVFPAGATVAWDIATANPGVAGCRELLGLEPLFLNTVGDTYPYASILNNRDGVVNFNFVSTAPFDATAAMLFSPRNLYSSITPTSIIDQNENTEQYIQLLLNAPFIARAVIGQQNFVSVSVYDTANDPSIVPIASTVAHESLHGFALRHRTISLADPYPDLVALSENIPVILPVVGEGHNAQNFMWFARNDTKLDVDVLQSIVARGVSLLAPNAGGLTLSPEVATMDLGVRLDKVNFRFTVTRGGVPVPNASVEFYLKDSNAIEFTSVRSVITDVSGIATISFRASTYAGNASTILAVVKEGNDNASATAIVTVVAVTTVILTPNALPADSASTSLATATAIPAGRVLTWSIQGNALGGAINPATGVVTAGNSGGTITVRATHVPSGAFAEGALTLVRVENVILTPAAITANGTATSTATATVTPGGRALTWSIDGNALGCTINPSTGVITAGVTAGTITVRATDTPSGAFATGVLTLNPK